MGRWIRYHRFQSWCGWVIPMTKPEHLLSGNRQSLGRGLTRAMLVHTGRFRLVQPRSRGECQAKKHILIKSASG